MFLWDREAARISIASEGFIFLCQFDTDNICEKVKKGEVMNEQQMRLGKNLEKAAANVSTIIASPISIRKYFIRPISTLA